MGSGHRPRTQGWSLARVAWLLVLPWGCASGCGDDARRDDPVADVGAAQSDVAATPPDAARRDDLGPADGGDGRADGGGTAPDGAGPDATEAATDATEAEADAAQVPVDAADAQADGGERDGGADGGPSPFPRGLVPAVRLGHVRGFQVARAIVHLHSVFSHDACDGQPVDADGAPNEPCVDDLRAALCTDRVDFALMTEHYDSMARTLDFDALFLQRAGDTWVDADEHHAANAVHCPNGHTAHILPGLEGGDGELSPLGLHAHPGGGTPQEIEAAYKDGSAEGVARLREAGAVTAAIHLEGQDSDWLATADLDTLEIGNLHVLIDPRYRVGIGLDPATPINAFASYLQEPAAHPPADLVFLEFHERLELYLQRWDGVLAQRAVAGFAGNDSHRNVLNVPMGDGERPDSYRRMLKWYVNHLLVTERTPAQARAALAQGRAYMVFEVLGAPLGFAFWAEREATGEARDMGETLDSDGDVASVRLRASRPRALLDERPAADVPVTLRLYRITAAGSELLAETEGELDLPAPGPGRYRVELDIVPTHLQPYLLGHEPLLRPYPWIYSNPIEVR